MIEAGITIAVLVGLLVLGIPMIAALIAAVLLNLVMMDAWAATLPQVVVSGLSRFTLIALPLFVLAGGIMNASGISARLFDFATSLVGWMRGGLAQVDVLLSVFFGGMVGSSSADLAGTGTITIPAMKKHGYPADYACAITASSSGIGPVLPPSSPMILYSAITGASLGALFIAGIIPGLLLGAMLMAIVAALARRKGWPRFGAFVPAEVWRTGTRAGLSFGMPAVIIGGLVVGVFTPTEAGAFGAVYAAALACLVYRSLSLAALYRVLVNAVQLTGELLLIVSLSTALGWALSNARVPELLAVMIDGLVVYDSEFLRLLAILALAIVAGMFLDPLIPVLVPVVLPTVIAFDIDLVHFGIIMVLAAVIGQVTPPVGIALVITARIAGIDQMRVFMANIPFLLGILALTILIIAIPEIATWLPSVLT
jgi:tripartite ATP-independent transporter DctM subunit